MKAMVLAAGRGTRLRPLTDTRPKALVDVAGRTPLEITLTRLCDSGVREVIVNVHHFADQITDYLQAHRNFGMRVEISREDDLLLDTGGGLKKAAWFFLEEASRAEPFFLHNVDVISTIDLRRMAEFHVEHRPLATLAVQRRESSRQLLFDAQQRLCGRQVGETKELVRPSPAQEPLGFSGIHVISPRIFELMTEQGVFSIVDVYLRLGASGETILAFRADEYDWRDLGRPESLRQAATSLSRAHRPRTQF